MTTAPFEANGASDAKVEEIDAYIAYETLKKYCDNMTCECCLFCLNSNSCCAFYNRAPMDFPKLVLGENKKRELFGMMAKDLELSLEQKRL